MALAQFDQQQWICSTASSISTIGKVIIGMRKGSGYLRWEKSELAL